MKKFLPILLIPPATLFGAAQSASVTEPVTLAGEALSIPVDCPRHADFRLFISLRNNAADPTKKYRVADKGEGGSFARLPGWNVVLGADTLCLKPESTLLADDTHKPRWDVSCHGVTHSISGIGPDATILIYRRDGKIEFQAASGRYGDPVVFYLPEQSPVDVLTVDPHPGADITLRRLDFEAFPDPIQAIRDAEIPRPVENFRNGDYAVIPTAIDTNYARVHTGYRLRLHAASDGSFILTYLSADEPQPHGWIPGMLKAVLTPIAAGEYSVTWYNQAGTPMTRNVAAHFDARTSDLVIDFIPQRTTLTLRRLTVER